jgi:hypothetical protein
MKYARSILIDNARVIHYKFPCADVQQNYVIYHLLWVFIESTNQIKKKTISLLIDLFFLHKNCVAKYVNWKQYGSGILGDVFNIVIIMVSFWLSFQRASLIDIETARI